MLILIPNVFSDPVRASSPQIAHLDMFELLVIRHHHTHVVRSAVDVRLLW